MTCVRETAVPPISALMRRRECPWLVKFDIG